VKALMPRSLTWLASQAGPVRVPHRWVIEFVLVGGAQVFESAGGLVVVGRDVVLPVGMHELLVVMLLEALLGGVPSI
jgi:hypothetical protein